MSFATGTHRTSKRGGKDYIYLLHAPGCFANGNATTDAAFSSFFFTLFHYITAITDRVTIAVFIPAIFSMFAGRLKVWAKSGVVNVACFHIQK